MFIQRKIVIFRKSDYYVATKFAYNKYICYLCTCIVYLLWGVHNSAKYMELSCIGHPSVESHSASISHISIRNGESVGYALPCFRPPVIALNQNNNQTLK